MQLRALSDGLWCVDGMARLWGGVRFPCRCVIARLPDGGLALISPLPEMNPLSEQLRALGPVRALISQTVLHSLGVDDLRADFPDAALLGVKAVQRRRPDIPWTGTLDGTPHPLLAETFEQVPVDGMPKLHEVALVHRASGSLITGDLLFNIQHLDNVVLRLMMRLNRAYRRFGPSRVARSLIADKQALARTLERLASMGYDRVIPCHGDILESGGRQAVEQAFAFLKA